MRASSVSAPGKDRATDRPPANSAKAVQKEASAAKEDASRSIDEYLAAVNSLKKDNSELEKEVVGLRRRLDKLKSRSAHVSSQTAAGRLRGDDRRSLPQTESRTESKAESKAESKTEEGKTESKTDTKTEVKTESDAEGKDEDDEYAGDFEVEPPPDNAAPSGWREPLLLTDKAETALSYSDKELSELVAEYSELQRLRRGLVERISQARERQRALRESTAAKVEQYRRIAAALLARSEGREELLLEEQERRERLQQVQEKITGLCGVQQQRLHTASLDASVMELTAVKTFLDGALVAVEQETDSLRYAADLQQHQLLGLLEDGVVGRIQDSIAHMRASLLRLRRTAVGDEWLDGSLKILRSDQKRAKKNLLK